jgi:regulator of sigma E protease
MNGRAVYGWGDVNWIALSSMLNDDGLTIEVERQGARHTVTFKPTDSGWPGVTAAATSQLGLTPYETSVIVRSVSQSGAGQRDGIQVGDVIKSLNGVAVLSSSFFTTQVRQLAEQDILIGLERNGVALELRTKPDRVVPEDKSAAIGRLGIGLGGGIELQTTQQSLLDSLVYGVRHTWDVSAFSLIAFGKMVTGQMSLKMLSGPVTIADAAGQSARIGFTAYIAFLAMVSVSLGILNLLPVPVLDGGHLMYYFVEVVRGKPLADIWFEWGQKVGIVLIGAMSAIALFNDLQRVIFHG